MSYEETKQNLIEKAKEFLGDAEAVWLKDVKGNTALINLNYFGEPLEVELVGMEIVGNEIAIRTHSDEYLWGTDISYLREFSNDEIELIFDIFGIDFDYTTNKNKKEMKTILLKEVIPSESCKKLTHYEIVEYKDKKFLIYVEGSNGDCLGFNHKCCLKVMNENGSWDNVVDNYALGFSANNDGMYYGHSADKKKIIVDENVKQFKDYIQIVY